jgi:hypothetical protein
MNRTEAGRAAAMAMAGGRVAFGVGMAAAPRMVAVAWVGREGRRSGTQLLTRAVGGRDLALGIGALVALLKRRDARVWIAAQAAADLTDLIATAVAGDDLPPPGRRAIMALAGAATVANVGTLLAAGGDNGASETSQADVTVPAEQTADGLEAVVIGGEGQDDVRR